MLVKFDIRFKMRILNSRSQKDSVTTEPVSQSVLGFFGKRKKKTNKLKKCSVFNLQKLTKSTHCSFNPSVGGVANHGCPP